MIRDLSHIRTAPVANCWCGSNTFSPFNEQYKVCRACGTLVGREMPGINIAEIYQHDYWDDYQTDVLGQPPLIDRARADLSERCLHWMRALLKYKQPPGRILEIGAGNGGFVALLAHVGFDVSGVEMSPFAIKVARDVFGVELVKAPIKEDRFSSGEFDSIVLFDVLEHLIDPAAAIAEYARLLKPDGILLIQTPRYVSGTSHEAMLANKDAFLHQLMPLEHLFLFTEDSLARLLKQCGFPHVVFEKAIFSIYDMFVVASQSELTEASGERVAAAINRPGAPQLIQALLDLYERSEKLTAERLELYTQLHSKNEEIIELRRGFEEMAAELRRRLPERLKLYLRRKFDM